MIAQTIAIEHRARIRSLTSIMSTTGDPAVGQPRPEGLRALAGPPAVTREEVSGGCLLPPRIFSLDFLSPSCIAAPGHLRRPRNLLYLLDNSLPLHLRFRRRTGWIGSPP